jgi:hypothetical protein
MTRLIFIPTLLLLGSCAIPDAIGRLEDCPPTEFGRPAWVRACAGVGGWVGGVLGAVASVVVLPVTWPVSLACGDSMRGQARTEFLFWPVTAGASAGHFMFGATPEALDFAFRRAWVGDAAPTNSYELVPMAPPKVEQGLDAGR